MWTQVDHLSPALHIIFYYNSSNVILPLIDVNWSFQGEFIFLVLDNSLSV